LNWGWEIAGEQERKVEMRTAVGNGKPGGSVVSIHLQCRAQDLCPVFSPPWNNGEDGAVLVRDRTAEVRPAALACICSFSFGPAALRFAHRVSSSRRSVVADPAPREPLCWVVSPSAAGSVRPGCKLRDSLQPKCKGNIANKGESGLGLQTGTREQQNMAHMTAPVPEQT